MKDIDWDVKVDEFENDTPLGPRKFTNIIATMDPTAERRLVLACHYDSKLMPPVNGKYFKGATDSAVPCAMMLDIAHSLHQKLKKRSVSFVSFSFSLSLNATFNFSILLVCIHLRLVTKA